MSEEKPIPPPPTPQEKSPSTEPEASREERIAAARAKAEALKAQRAGAGPAAPAAAKAAPAGTAPTKAAGGVPGRATSANPGGAPPAPPQNPKIEALGTINQSVELRSDPTEAQNIERLLGGLGAYKNPLRGTWQLDYRYYAEALKRLRAAGYQVEGRDYLGRPLEKWLAERRGWTRLG